jgi:hypothetical protein
MGKETTRCMRYAIYTDESNTTGSRYMLIGGLWLPLEAEARIKIALQAVRDKHNLQHEMKWTKVSRTMLAAYQSFVDVFFRECALSFHCIVIDRYILDYAKFHKGDRELGFYKFYFLLISRKLAHGNLYWLYTDERRNHKPYRLSVLNLTVNGWWQRRSGERPLRAVEPRCSHDEDMLQLADLLLGAIGYCWNDRKESAAKVALAKHIARGMGWPSLRTRTPPYATKLNIWVWDPSAKKQNAP